MKIYKSDNIIAIESDYAVKFYYEEDGEINVFCYCFFYQDRSIKVEELRDKQQWEYCLHNFSWHQIY